MPLRIARPSGHDLDLSRFGAHLRSDRTDTLIVQRGPRLFRLILTEAEEALVNLFAGGELDKLGHR